MKRQSDAYFCTDCWRNHVRHRGDIYSEHKEHAVRFTKRQLEGLSEAAMQKQKIRNEVVVEYVIDMLKRDETL
jgi:hypothetical protein